MSTTNSVELTLKDGFLFEVHGNDGASLTVDASPPLGVPDNFTPMDLLLAGLGGCTAMDVIGILRKKRLHVTDYRIEVSGTRADENPRVFTHITVTHIVTGEDVAEETVRHAAELSEKKYCPAWAMLSRTASISSRYIVLTPAPAFSI